MSIFFKLKAMSKPSSQCMIDGTKENEYMVPIDIGDMITEQSSGGNSSELIFSPSQKGSKKFIRFLDICNKLAQMAF